MAALPQIDSVKATPAPDSRTLRESRFPRFNLALLVIVGLLVALGLAVVHSAVESDADFSFSRQVMGVGFGIVAMMVVWRFDYRHLSNMTVVLLVISVALILSPHLPVIGVEQNGARSWINVGMQVQPGEFAKATVILLAASVVARYGGRLDNPREYVKACAIMLIPVVCILTQPDLGTGLVYVVIAAVALIVGGARPKFLLLTVLALVALLLAVLALDELLKYQTSDGSWEYRLLKNYQRNRILVFLDPAADTSGSGYNLLQAQIAIGSGGLFGKGLGNGTQAAPDYLPEAPTDFIFCVLAEELGFVGVCVLIGLYAALIAVAFRVARRAGVLFGTIAVMCTAGMWLFQIMENIGMTCGLMPITGIPLPFVSYGSSFMLVNFMLVGLIGSVSSHGGANGKKDVYATTP